MNEIPPFANSAPDGVTRKGGVLMTLHEVARAVGGEVYGDQVRAPGPGHSPKDKSLCVKFDPCAPGGFIVHSFAGDDPILCKDFRSRQTCPSAEGPE